MIILSMSGKLGICEALKVMMGASRRGVMKVPMRLMVRERIVGGSQIL